MHDRFLLSSVPSAAHFYELLSSMVIYREIPLHCFDALLADFFIMRPTAAKMQPQHDVQRHNNTIVLFMGHYCGSCINLKPLLSPGAMFLAMP
jgi:thiol-disulfide isomerase/thioredoxin